MQVADILIQAGHEGSQYGSGDCSPYGDEREWTPIVADEAAQFLQALDYNVLRVSADLNDDYDVKMAVFIHFDSSGVAKNSGASVGYECEKCTVAMDWKKLYSRFWPFEWMNDNFSQNLSNYYGFEKTRASMFKILLELGDLTNEEQARWLQPRLQWLGRLIGYFLAEKMGKTNIMVPEPILRSFAGMFI